MGATDTHRMRGVQDPGSGSKQGRKEIREGGGGVMEGDKSGEPVNGEDGGESVSRKRKRRETVSSLPILIISYRHGSNH